MIDRLFREAPGTAPLEEAEHFFRKEYLPEATSTNDILKARAAETADENILLRTGFQSAGRGRMGRVWIMPPGAQLAMSFLLRPRLAPDQLPALTLAFGLAAAVAGGEDVVDRLGLAAAEALWALSGADIRIKWPNDLLAGGRKLAGILLEYVPSEKDGVPDAVVAGIGVNIEKSAYPDEIKDRAVSLEECAGSVFDPADLADRIASRFALRYQTFLTEGFAPMKDAYNALLAGTGASVEVSEADGSVRKVREIGADEQGRLRVLTEEGREEALFGGEISLHGIYGKE